MSFQRISIVALTALIFPLASMAGCRAIVGVEEVIYEEGGPPGAGAPDTGVDAPLESAADAMPAFDNFVPPPDLVDPTFCAADNGNLATCAECCAQNTYGGGTPYSDLVNLAANQGCACKDDPSCSTMCDAICTADTKTSCGLCIAETIALSGCDAVRGECTATSGKSCAGPAQCLSACSTRYPSR